MIVIPSLTITDNIFTSSTVSEPSSGEQLWNSGTTYGLGDEVIVVSTNSHKKYESLQAGNTNHNPASSTDWWTEIGVSNKWKMFDLLRNTTTVGSSPMTVVLTPGERINSIALLGLVADTVTITVENGSEVVYQQEVVVSSRDVFDWYDYFFEPFTAARGVLKNDLPPYTDAVITVTIEKASGNVECGALVIGNYVFIGDVEQGVESDALNFSRITRDFEGNVELIQRRSVPKTSQTLLLDKSRVNKARATRDALNAIPAVWAGISDNTDGYFEALFILGIYKRFSFNFSHPEHALINLELEEI